MNTYEVQATGLDGRDIKITKKWSLPLIYIIVGQLVILSRSNLIGPVIEIRNQLTEDSQLVGDKNLVISFNNAPPNCTQPNPPFLLCTPFLEDRLS